MPTRFPREGNKYGHLNLPVEYDDLTNEGRRLARINAMRLQEEPEDLVGAWSLMSEFYLQDDPKAGFYPGFFKRYVPSPPIHYQTIFCIGDNPYNLFSYPRSFAKSTLIQILTMVLFLTRHRFYTLLIYPRQTMVTSIFSEVFQYQFESNERILNDFGVTKPKMGEAIWSKQTLINAKTRSRISGMPVKGSLYGERPDQIVCDDCEFDPQLQKTTTELIEEMDNLMHNTILPMMDQGGSATSVLTTLHNERTWASRWIHADEKDEPRVGLWNRIHHGAEDRNEDGTLLWNAKFSEKVLEHERLKLGPRHYAIQRLNKPSGSEDTYFMMHPKLSQYEVVEPDMHYAGGLVHTPLDSTAILRSWRKTDSDKVEQIERPLGRTVSRMFRIMTMDYAKCMTPTSDYVCYLVTGVERSALYRDTWWLLDLFIGRVRGGALYRGMLAMALKWRVSYIGIESIAAQEEVYNNALDYLPAMAEKYGWNPRTFPLGGHHDKSAYKHMEKSDRINALEWRYNQHRILYPYHLRLKPMWRMAYSQTLNWTGEEGCLTYDDFIDTLAMNGFMLGKRRHSQADQGPSAAPTPLEILASGGRDIVPGLPAGLAISPSEMPLEVLHDIIDRRLPPSAKQPRSQRRLSQWTRARVLRS